MKSFRCPPRRARRGSRRRRPQRRRSKTLRLDSARWAIASAAPCVRSDRSGDRSGSLCLRLAR
uniref:Uncharacterized protein n=1 Tax=uncultured marine virus TaxID=186617 RepID=A0A0F7L3R7_9VIRU|nr:hypothetical protein [uncultured marine virus]